MISGAVEYPPAPWTLKGSATGRVCWRDSAELAPRLPDGFRVVNLWPGRTVGGVVVARYGAGSTLEYSELIVFGGIVRCGCEIGLWVSEIYVDSPESVAGGREIWGLPKEPAEFEWEDGMCRVRRGDRVLYSIELTRPAVRMPMALPFPTLTVVGGSPAVFGTRIRGMVGICRPMNIADLEMTVDAPRSAAKALMVEASV